MTHTGLLVKSNKYLQPCVLYTLTPYAQTACTLPQADHVRDVQETKFADTFAAAGWADSYYRLKKKKATGEQLWALAKEFGVVIIQVMLTLHLPGIPQPSTGMGVGDETKEKSIQVRCYSH